MKDNIKAVHKALQDLPQGLDATYDEAMIRIRGQDSEKFKRAEQVLTWKSCTLRPLTVTEIQHALAVDSRDTDFDEEALPDKDVLVSICAGLVTIDQANNIICLVHYTTQEYFERIRITRFPDAETIIAITCLTYLSFPIFSEGHRFSDQYNPLRRYPFLHYAAQYCADHARAGQEEAVKELA